jgi:predicted nucleotide-binding protein
MKNTKISVFISSSRESLDIAYKLRNLIEKDAIVDVWDGGRIAGGSTNLDELIKIAQRIELCICIFSNDDILVINEVSVSGKTEKKNYSVARDNVILEYGIFISALGKENVIIIHPENLEKQGKHPFKLPSDIGSSITTIRYDSSDEQVLNNSLQKISKQISEKIQSKNKTRLDYLERFLEKKEPPFLKSREISKTRIYELLLYMFKDEYFKEFRAFDLAFNRWEEAIRPKDSQIQNISAEIFDSMEILFQRVNKKLPLDFKRILVITQSQFNKQDTTFHILEKINHFEKKFIARFDLKVETRIYIAKVSDSIYFKEYNDFAMFTGKEEEFAIVEKLSSPDDRIASPDCFICIESDDIQKRKNFFDNYWKNSITLENILQNYLLEQTSIESPVLKAFNLLEKEFERKSLENVSLIIETSYIDMRTPKSDERKQHTIDAFFLIEKIQKHFPSIGNNLLVDTFINDYSFSGSEFVELDTCNKEYCKTENFDEEFKNVIIENIRLQLIEQNRPFHISEENFIMYGMRETRNKVVNRVQKAINNELLKDFFRQEESNLFAEIGNENIALGHFNNNKQFVPRCTLLMAEHYFELFELAKSKNNNIEELWIIDFNIQSESKSVSQGAKVGFILHKWEPPIKVNIINCNYRYNGKEGDIKINKGPQKLNN